MGSRIAAHFANAGIPVLLLDLTTAAAAKGIETALKQKPGAFFTESAATASSWTHAREPTGTTTTRSHSARPL